MPFVDDRQHSKSPPVSHLIMDESMAQYWTPAVAVGAGPRCMLMRLRRPDQNTALRARIVSLGSATDATARR